MIEVKPYDPFAFVSAMPEMQKAPDTVPGCLGFFSHPVDENQDCNNCSFCEWCKKQSCREVE